MSNKKYEELLLKWINEMQATAQTGIAYTKDPYDKERYQKLLDLSGEIASVMSGFEPEKVQKMFQYDKGYATPKLDVRAFITHGEEVLFVKERSEGLWALPGGWVDVGESATEAIIREVKEETGYDVRVIRLLALWDKLKHDHPPQWPHAHKCFFHCEINSGDSKLSHEIAEVCMFKLDSLPPLSSDRVTQTQLLKLNKILIGALPTSFD